MRALDQIPGPPWPADDGTYFAPPVPIRRRDRRWLPWVLFLLTLITTTWVGGSHYLAFALDFRFDADFELTTASYLAQGLWYSLTILAILGCHEMGHYLACLHYRVDATPPYFLPAPLPLTGTLGAFIRIRSRIPSKAALFDIGVAGPIAGFVIAVPALFVGLWLSHVAELPANVDGFVELGEPLLFRLATWMVFGTVPDGYAVNLHPMAFAAWFGLLATALNLFPIGQLDGGHVTYAVLGRRSSWVTLGMIGGAIALTAFVSLSWLVWTLLLIAMLLAMGPHHPPTLDDSEPLDRNRRLLAVVALAMLILCFTPAPIEPFVTGAR